MSDRPDSGAAIEQEPRSGAPPVDTSDDEFWRLAKRGLVAWGREPSTEEIVGYWRGLIDDERREAAARTAPPTADPITRLADLTALAQTNSCAPAATPTSLATLDGPIAMLTTLLRLGRPATAAPTMVVTAEAVEWLTVPVAGMPPPLVTPSNRTWWRVPAARPAPSPEAEAELQPDHADPPSGPAGSEGGGGTTAVGESSGRTLVASTLTAGEPEIASHTTSQLRFASASEADADGATAATSAGGRSVTGAQSANAALASVASAVSAAAVAASGSVEAGSGVVSVDAEAGASSASAAETAEAAYVGDGEPAEAVEPEVGAACVSVVPASRALGLVEAGSGVVSVEAGGEAASVGEGEPAEAVEPEAEPACVGGGAVGVATAGGEAAGEGWVGVGLAGGGVGYVEGVGLLDRRRRVQQAGRGCGRHIALPVAPLDAYERELRHGADAAAAERLEITLRAAAAGAGPDGLPPVRWVEASAGEVLVALADASGAPAGFAEVAADRDELERAAARALPPLPLLAPLGRTATGRERLIDLESRGVTTVDGPADDVLGLLRSTVVAMALSTWCTPLRIVVVGLERDLAGFPDVEAVDSLDVALTYAEAHVHQVGSALAAVGETSLSRVRALGLSSSAAGALLVVSARPPDDSAVGRRLAALAESTSSGIGVLLRHPPDPEVGLADAGSRLCIGPDGALHDGTRPPVWARRLDAVDARRLLDLLTVAGRGGDGETVRRPHSDGHDREAAEDVDVLVGVLGDVEVVRPGLDGWRAAEEPGVEVLAYLALREASVTHATLEAALFPDGAPGAPDGHAVERSVAAAVELVGPGLVRRPAPGRFAVSERVATDHGLLCDLVARADDAVAVDDLATAADRLTSALGLVRSAPLGGPGRRFAWAGPAREAIVAQVVDAADSLACLRARTDDWAAVDEAAVAGLRAAPASERLHRWRMRAAHAAGDLDKVHELFGAACDLVADPAVGVEPEGTLQPETVELLEALVARRPAGEPIAPAGADPATPARPGEVRRLAPDRPLPITEELPEVAATPPPDALIA